MSEGIKKLNRILSKVLAISEGSINDETSPQNTETWDSYNALMLVSELEREFNLHFTMDEVINVKNVGDIKTALRKYNIEL
ncbi:MAG: acyl carrier protein [bacterium]|nr:acyl carrier protein [bacterium]